MPHTPTTGSPNPATTTSATSALPLDRRSLAPDLARGVMLLFIALAHTHIFAMIISGGEALGSTADQIATAGNAMFVELRAYPMFAALFGYGLAQIYRRRTEQGHEWPWVRALLRRRSRWLIVFGVVHAALLFFGDILAVYGLLALIFVGVLRFRDRTLVVLAVLWVPLGATIQGVVAAEQAMTGQSIFLPMGDGFVEELVFRLTMYAMIAPVMVISTVVPFLVGILAARHRVLEEPRRHLKLLRGAAFAGLPLGVLGGLPLALIKAEVWPGYSPLDAMFAGGLHQVAGYAAGFGYAALIALIAVRLSDRRGPITNALEALGQRSLTFYLAQSAVWAALFASYTLHFQLTSPALAAGIAVAVWLTTVVLADLMRRRNTRGPAEVALRRLTYRS
ncbi:DUF418 domain-containing protein [Nocardiopsis metallicus]|uniref:Putative membrane protein YeiB n=1 Tax=Nocardiopsis metallicus TaxID=179819 RepID=A0A840WEC1_9ACTN|nr:DUF418 domain-containing protein [Nocardiopsis metallicus]MBB5493763.1 putative membrane protein YeiB [Nocardiopsis metallicus]